MEISAETPDGIRATLTASSEAFPCPTDGLFLRIFDAEESEDTEAGADAIAADLEDQGLKSVGIRWLDISVWRWEPVISEAPVPSGSETEETASGSDELFGEAEANDLSPEAYESPPEGDEQDGEAVGTAAEMRLVQVIPTGPVEIVVEGLSEDRDTRIYRIDPDGYADRLDTYEDPFGRVVLETDLN